MNRVRKPKIAVDLPPPAGVSGEALRAAVRESRAWHDAVARLTAGMERRR